MSYFSYCSSSISFSFILHFIFFFTSSFTNCNYLISNEFYYAIYFTIFDYCFVFNLVLCFFCCLILKKFSSFTFYNLFILYSPKSLNFSYKLSTLYSLKFISGIIILFKFILFGILNDYVFLLSTNALFTKLNI